MKLVLKILGKIKKVADKTIKRIQRKTDSQFVALEKWYKEDPHNLKRSTFEHLTEDSIVFDLGGYEGEWASDIIARYNCNIYIFEPVSEYFEIIKERFKHNPKVFCFQVGLSDKSYKTEINIDEFASSIFNESKNSSVQESIQIKSFNTFVAELQLKEIDLAKINIEGGEYDLLESLILSEKIKDIDQILVQFHDFVPDATERKQSIKHNLEKTHNVVFDYEYIWELWKRK